MDGGLFPCSTVISLSTDHPKLYGWEHKYFRLAIHHSVVNIETSLLATFVNLGTISDLNDDLSFFI